MTSTIAEHLLLRVARQIHARLAAGLDRRLLPEPPYVAWQAFGRAARRLELARARHWNFCTGKLISDHRRAARGLLGQLDECARRLEGLDQPRRTQSEFEIFADLRSLSAEFEGIRLDLGERTISVVTADIVLESIDLGPFEIVLHWDRIGRPQPYSVMALEPNRAASDPLVTHPHVRGDTLCPGEGRLPIREALEQGRLLDFFLLCRQVLRTHNPPSAYVPLDRWSGTECYECGALVTDEELCACERCERDICLDCAAECEVCGSCCCASCHAICPRCKRNCCSGCLSECVGCNEPYCESCLTAETCPNCRKPQEKPLNAVSVASVPRETLDSSAGLAL